MTLHLDRKWRVAGLAMTLALAASGTAFADGTAAAPPDTGTCTPIGTQIVFYYGRSSGNCTSPHWSGGGPYKLCADAPGSNAGNNFDAKFRHDRSLFPDETIRELMPYFNSPRRCSSAFGTDSGSSYHTDAAWPYVNGAGDGANGYSRGEGQ